MKIDWKFRDKFNYLLTLQGGVLTFDDLWTIIAPTSQVDFYRQLKKLINEKLIRKVLRTFYVGDKFSIGTLIMTMRPDSYLSLEFALAYYNMIGTYSASKVRPIVAGRVRPICTEFLKIEFKSLRLELMFGVEVVDGVRMATREKALLDTLYFYQKGTKFYFDIYSDIDLSSVNREIVFKYLKKYKNRKFVKFVEDYFND